ncbi:hypothetical protein HQ393_11465 [Chitinibacter bivalviorum]|uniref:Uncharacterized protein n=1 Tax=Chitinibacter bivalviorum TaxID=2739434 RepID=A0A7H9BJG5_9NEIS|nr:hypothetical protein [Chitinibacter bivalviorum]QLG88800.1 hypothetical protein HQ393_11465 [Chitinibacter bivalviorum]
MKIRIGLMLLLLPLCVQADDWGKLFFSPAQRAGLKEAPSQATSLEPSSASVQRYDGVLQTPRKKTHWVDGQIAKPPANVKPGQSWSKP